MVKLSPFPIHSESHAIGDRALAILHYQIDCGKWVFRQKTGNDYGVDCELEFVENNLLRGKKIECQVKGTKHLENYRLSSRPNVISYRISVKTINYGLCCANPFVVFLVDVNSQSVFFVCLDECYQLGKVFEATSQNSTMQMYFDTNRTLENDSGILEEIIFIRQQ